MTIGSFVFKTANKFKKANIILQATVVFVVFIALKYIYNEVVGQAYLQADMLEGFSGQGKEFTLFYWKDCGHCKTMMPEWDKFMKSNTNKGVKVNKLEKDENPGLMDKMGVQGFPTILLTKNGEVIQPYEGERTAEAFQSFLNGN
jgi:thiol-disulfide isomerase/thioredoxin